MKHKDTNNILDEITAGIRDEQLDPTMVAGAAERVWKRLSEQQLSFAIEPERAPVERIRNCADFQTLISSYLHGELSQARALLLEDHTQECIPCRRALKEARTGVPSRATARSGGFFAPQSNAGARLASPIWKWGIAAALILGFGVAVTIFMERFSGAGSNTFAATIEAADGPVYRISDDGSRALSAGAQLRAGERIRTAKDSEVVVRLADGSVVEMRERSEFSVTENNRGTTIQLDRGSVIVQAAKQRPAHRLYVATPDSLVSVTGTIFSVNSGTKGSRVSVIEGEVRVNHGGDEKILRPGDQTVTQSSLERVPVQEEVSWSRNAARYASLVAEFASLRHELNQRVSQPGVRYSTRFLEMVPEETVLYAALPNLAATLSESHRIMQERISQNAALREWWKENHNSPAGAPSLDQVIEKVREFGEYLGAEIVVSAGMDQQGNPDGPLVLAELKDAAGFQAFAARQISELAGAKDGPTIRLIADPLAAAPTPAQNAKAQQEIFIWIQNDFFAASPQLRQLRQLATTTKAPGTNRFAGTPFYSRIAEVYREGAGLIVAADLEKIISHSMREGETAQATGEEARREAYRQLGILNLKHFVVEQKEGGGKTRSRAVLSFNEPLRGIASWLAAPGPMGALEFISPDANVAMAFVVKEPVSLVDDLLGFLETAAPDLRRHFRDLEAQHGLDVRRDFAAPLGGEFAFAIDGPVLPTPSWKMVFEVYDQARLQQTFEQVVEELNRWAAKEGQKGLRWERADIGGRTFYALKSDDHGLEVHYAYVDGYLIAAPSRALVDRAIRYADAGYTLLRSPRLLSALPEDGNVNFSALFYHDLAPLLKPLADRIGDSAKSLPADEQRALKSLAAGAAVPTLAYAYAQGDRITIAANSEGGPFGLSPASLLGLPNSFALQNVLEGAMPEKK